MGIQIINLTKKYGNQKALDSVDLSIQKNRITGLLGPNGAGKTTLMNCIMDIIRYDSGDILIDDQNQKTASIELKKTMGFLAENNPLYSEMYVKEYLAFVASIFKLPKYDLQDIITKVGLNVEQHKKIKQLSKGYKQRVGLAQAILHQPKYLILDEPTNGLDPNQILEIRQLIRELAKDKTVILSTHIMQEVEVLCDDIILIDRGKILSHQPLSKFKGRYKSLEEAFHQYTQKASPSV